MIVPIHPLHIREHRLQALLHRLTNALQEMSGIVGKGPELVQIIYCANLLG